MDDLAIDLNFKDPAATRNERQVLNALAEGVQQRGRQTDGLRRIVSHHAEGDLHVHLSSPGLRHYRFHQLLVPAPVQKYVVPRIMCCD